MILRPTGRQRVCFALRNSLFHQSTKQGNWGGLVWFSVTGSSSSHWKKYIEAAFRQ